MSIRIPNTPYKYCALADHGPRDVKLVKYVVVHGMEGTLESALNWFNSPWNREHTGAHVLVNDKQRLQLLGLERLAYHAPPNHLGVGIEHEGFAAWSKARWLTHPRMLLRSANAAGYICWRLALGLPHHGPTSDERTNIVGHYQLPQGGHPCPGPNFPFDTYCKLARLRYRALVRKHR